MEKNKTRAEHLEAWKASGLTRVDYARKFGINYGTFKGWVYECAKDPQKVKWKPIKIKEEKEEPEDSKNFFEIRLGENWKSI
ncbi:MAG: hypothetical protein IT569_01710 [Leptospiraceae bacterium]|nr:hypothetical protein [Leptospiraceae bacterium]